MSFGGVKQFIRAFEGLEIITKEKEMFETHKLNEKGLKEVGNLKRRMKSVVEFVLEDMPEGREKAIFKTKIEEAMFFGTKAVASDPENHTEIIKYD